MKSFYSCRDQPKYINHCTTSHSVCDSSETNPSEQRGAAEKAQGKSGCHGAGVMFQDDEFIRLRRISDTKWPEKESSPTNPAIRKSENRKRDGWYDLPSIIA